MTNPTPVDTIALMADVIGALAHGLSDMTSTPNSLTEQLRAALDQTDARILDLNKLAEQRDRIAEHCDQVIAERNTLRNRIDDALRLIGNYVIINEPGTPIDLIRQILDPPDVEAAEQADG